MLSNKGFVILLLFVGCICNAQTIDIKVTLLDQCSGEEFTQTAIVRKDSSVKILGGYGGFLPTHNWETNFDFYQHVNDLPFTSSPLNDTIFDTLYLPRLTFGMLISNPPMSWYEVCGEKANGTVTDYYSPGKPRMSGTFEDGQPTDTVFKYDYIGGIHSWVYSVGEIYSTKEFHKSGNVKRSYNTNGRSDESIYFTSGTLKEESYMKRLGGLKAKEYYENGQLKRFTKKRKSKRYYPNGTMSSKVQTLSVFRKSIVKEDYVNHNVNYKMTIYDSLLNSKTLIRLRRNPNFYGVEIEQLSELNAYNFDRAVFKTGSKKTHKISRKYEQIGEDYKLIFHLYSKVKGDWVHTKSIAKGDLWKTIEEMSPKF